MSNKSINTYKHTILFNINNNMTDKQQMIAQTRQNKRVDEAHKHADDTKKQKQAMAVSPSYLTFANVSVLENHDELYSLVSNVIRQHGHEDESVARSSDKKADTVTYEMVEKTLCLDIAHHVEKAFKHYHPKMEMHSPKDNEFYRITVTFNS